MSDTVLPQEELDHLFRYVMPDDVSRMKHERARKLIWDLANEFNHLLPWCDEAKEAIHLLDLSLQRANSAIARH